jgi:superfamily II DNA or RNA helicase
MAYFEDHYSLLGFPIKHEGDRPVEGFREAQRGALFAIASHFTRSVEPAIVTMPTGSGKTAVLEASAYLLRAERILVLTPSRLVREQIAEDFATLGVLKRLTALSNEVAPPKVMATTGRITTNEAWEAMRNFDVVVATVQSISPSLEEVPPPPPDLFDLILVDEAHHSPALTWNTLIEGFPEARKILFTATPFRRDDREIKGRFVYSYDLKRAYEDGAFGHIDYVPVETDAADSTREAEDRAIARAAEAQFLADRAANLDHLLMVRTDSRARASELSAVYAAHTRLKLKLVTGDQSLVHVRRVLAKLDAGELDGIICVNMMGEGFDMPRLKIAAVHSPHRSLAVTLQFVGRFARTVGERIGNATFLAPVSAIRGEARRLYAEGAVWAEIIPNLSKTRIQREIDMRELLESFEARKSVPDLADLSLYGLSLYAHVKIYRLREAPDLAALMDFGGDRETVYSWVNEGERTSVHITRQVSSVRWAADERLADVRFDIFVFYYDEKAKLLFICASKRAEGYYRTLARNLTGYDPRILPLSHISRVLKELGDPRFFQVGMKKRQEASLAESYRIMAGSHADEAIRNEDARLYDRGHCFGSAEHGEERLTIGLSSASKIWSNRTLSLAETLMWCRELARKINDKKAAVTGSKLDLLQTGETVTKVPSRPVFALWPNEVFLEPPMALFEDATGKARTVVLTEFELVLEGWADDYILFRLQHDLISTSLAFTLDGSTPLFAYIDAAQPRVALRWVRDEVDLPDYLNDVPMSFTLDDWSRLDGEEHFSAPEGGYDLFDGNQIDAIDWQAANVDITVEYQSGAGLATSIQGHLRSVLADGEDDVVYWDHGSGETADFVAFRRRDDGGVAIRFYHCKGSSGAQPGNRVGDVYEVCGQAVKGYIWCDVRRLVNRLVQRSSARRGMAQFVRGDLAALQAFQQARPWSFQMIVVQPGIRQGAIEQKLAEVLGAANSHSLSAGHLPMRLLGSPSVVAPRDGPVE